MEKGSSQQVELKDEGGAVGGGADRRFERSSLYFSSQNKSDNFEKGKCFELMKSIVLLYMSQFLKRPVR